MKLNLSTRPPDREKHKCLAVGFFNDERPPRGLCGFIDWRLNGLISREIRQAHIHAGFGEKVAIPYPERVNSDLLVLFGWGNVVDISYNRVYDVAYKMAEAIDAMKIQNFSFDLPGEGRTALSLAGMLEAMVTGFFDFLSGDVSKLTGMNICLLTSAERLKDVAAGISRFHENVRHMGSVDFSAMEPHFT